MDSLAGAMLGAYRMERRLGSGGYGEVILAHGPATTAPRSFMVIKAFQADRGDGLAQEALRTAEQIAQLKHPNILRAVETGVDGRAAFIAMPYLPSGSIESLAQAHGVSPALVAPIITQVSQGLYAAHALGVAHGDLKPANVFLHAAAGRPPLALVSDFGQAAMVGALLRGASRLPPDDRRSPLALALASARALAAPEQYNGPATPASDQYALAVIACLLLTGHYPQQGDDAHAPPASVASVLRQALSPDPAERFGDITAFAAALDAALADAKGIVVAAPRAHAAVAQKAAEVATVAAVAATPGVSAATVAASLAEAPSYAPTGNGLLDGLLQRVDSLTNGKAGLLQRAFTYVCIGGLAAVINLITLFVLYNVIAMPFSPNIHWLIGFIIAAVVSTMANFILNDWLTFSHLPGHARSWTMRCLRFYSTSLLGTIITLILSFACKTWLGMSALVAEAVAIIIALFVNFTMHHVWTYRHVAESHGAAPGGQPQEALAAPDVR